MCILHFFLVITNERSINDKNLSMNRRGYALVVGFPEGGGGEDPGLMWGNMGTFSTN